MIDQSFAPEVVKPMPKRIDELTPAQKAKMSEWADRWIEIGLRTGEADWGEFERAAKECYRYAGIPWPDVLVRVSSPIVLAFAAPAASLAIELIRRQPKSPNAVDGAVAQIEGFVGFEAAVILAVLVEVVDAPFGVLVIELRAQEILSP